jgi:hypothetical protein
MNFCPLLPHLLSHCVKVAIRDLHIVLLSVLWISWKPAQGRPYFSCGREWNCSYTCSAQPYGIMKVKNSLGKIRVLRHGPQQKLYSCLRDVHIHSVTRLPSAQLPNHYSTLPSVFILYWPLSSFITLRSEARMKFHSTYSKGWRHFEIPTRNGGQC